MSLWRLTAFALPAFVLLSINALAQVATGTYQLGTYDSLGPDTINVGNLNVMLNVPVIHKVGRAGTNFTYDLAYNGLVWSSSTGTWSPDANWGWAGQTQILTGYLHELINITYCQNHGRFPTRTISSVSYKDAAGIYHGWNGQIHQSFGQCTNDSDTLSNTWSTDGKYLIGSDGGPIYTPTGIQINPPLNSNIGSGSYVDTNGNEISTDGNGNFTDTIGAVALTISGSAPSTQTYAYVDASGANRSLTVSYVTHTVATNFGCSGVTEFSGTSIPLVDTITLPDSSAYHFLYEATPGATGSVTGRLASITLPAGGVITYTYSGANNGINCADGSPLGLTRKMTSVSGSPSRTYTRTVSGNDSHTTLVNEVGTHFDYDFVVGTDPTSVSIGLYQTNLSVTSNGSGTPFLSQQTCYNRASSPCTTQSLTLPITSVKQTNTLDGATQNSSVSTYDSAGDYLGTVSYDFGSATSSGPALLTDSRIYSNGLIGSRSLSDLTGTISETNYAYDSVALQPTSGVPQHTSGTNYGNLTQVSQFINPGINAQALTTKYAYYDTGSVYSQTSPSGGVTSYTYDSTNTHATGVAPPDPNGAGLSSSYTYDGYLGQLASSTNPNSTVTTITSSDGAGHPGQTVLTNGSTTLAKTTSSFYPAMSSVITYQGTNTSSETDTYYDGYSRPIRTTTQADLSHLYVVDTCYDAAGRTQFKSYPYTATSLGAQVCSGAGDAYTYDAMGRILSVTHGDSPATSVSYVYYGNSTKVTNENGVAHIYQTDGAGRQTIVCELTSTAINGVAPASCGTLYSGTGFVTSYAYSGNTTTVTQGSQTRTFVVDGLGRPVSKIEPESGITSYSYTYGSSGLLTTRRKPKAGQTSATVYTNTNTQSDVLGRVVSITYDDGITANKTFTYDAVPSGSSFSAGYAKGQMTSAAASNGAATLFSYDAAGRVNAMQQCIPGWCSTPALNINRSYTYNWTGSPITEQYSTPSGNISLNYGVNFAGQLTTVSGGQDTALSSLFSATTLTPYGPTAATLGNGVAASMSYDVFGHRSGLGITLGSTPLYANTATWSGQLVTASSDSVNGSGTYGYDSFSRLQSASMSTSQGSLNLGWTYDRYGNRYSQTAGGSYTGSVSQPSYSINTATNQINSPGFSYDAAGNLTSDGINTYTYDADGNVTAISGGTSASYIYDAQNRRVLTTVNGTTRAFGFNASGQRATVWDGSGNLLSAQYYAGAQPLAYWLASDGHVRFQHQDWVGTERFRTTYTGAVEGSFTSLPFGDGKATASGSDTDPYHYAGLDNDTEDLQHATYREVSTVQGRWLRPDPYDGSYNYADPQTLNRYAYTSNGPLSGYDPSGLENHQPPAGTPPPFTLVDGGGGLPLVYASQIGCPGGICSGPPDNEFDDIANLFASWTDSKGNLTAAFYQWQPLPGAPGLSDFYSQFLPTIIPQDNVNSPKTYQFQAEAVSSFSATNTANGICLIGNCTITIYFGLNPFGMFAQDFTGKMELQPLFTQYGIATVIFPLVLQIKVSFVMLALIKARPPWCLNTDLAGKGAAVAFIMKPAVLYRNLRKISNENSI